LHHIGGHDCNARNKLALIPICWDKVYKLKPKECTATHKREITKIERRKDKMNYKTLMFEEKMSSFYFILASFVFPLEKQHTPTSLM
jgi:hypothetical protein